MASYAFPEASCAQRSRTANRRSHINPHGVGYSKKCHEPFLDELVDQLPIRGAWACDVTVTWDSVELSDL